MARERYLLNAGEETIHQNEIKLETPKDKRKNWWYYNKVKVLAVVLVIAMFFSIFYSIFSKVKPDYTVALLTSYTMPSTGLDELERCIEEYAEDLNGDGQVVVQVSNYVMSGQNATTSDEQEKAQAEVAKLIVDASVNESIIFISDDTAFSLVEDNLSGFFIYNDGSDMPDEAEDFENARLEWTEFEGLSAFEPQPDEDTAYTSEILTELFERLSLSFRSKTESMMGNDETLSYYAECEELYERLKTGEKVVQTETEE